MPGSWLPICVGFASIGLLLGVTVASAAADSASGTLRIGAQRFALKYVFAVMERDGVAVARRSSRFSCRTRRFRTNCARLPTIGFTGGQAGARRGAARRDPGHRSGHRSLERRPHADPRGHRILFRDRILSGAERSPVRTGRAAGEPGGRHGVDEEADAGAHDETGAWTVEAEFRAAVIRRPAVSGVLTGTAALNSPQYKAVLEFLDACRKKDVDASAMPWTRRPGVADADDRRQPGGGAQDVCRDGRRNRRPEAE